MKKKKTTIILLNLIIIVSIITVMLASYYYSIYQEYLKNKEEHISTLEYYSHIINKKAYSKIYKKTPASYKNSDLTDNTIYTATTIYDINGKEIGKFSKENRNIISLNDVSPHFINALINTEDRQFYQHNGLNYKTIAYAVIQNIMAGRIIRGGSTISQQLAKVLFTAGEKTIKRKIYEMFITKELIEKNYDKNDILEMYVNYIYFGHNINGIQEASKLYFNKNAKDINITEAAFLAGIIANPSLYSPFKNTQKTKKRHLTILKTMSNTGLIKNGIYKKLHDTFWKGHNFKKVFKQRKYKETINNSPYIVEEVKRQIVKSLLEQKIFENANKAYNFLYTRGLKITTYIDIDLQQKAQQIVNKQLNNIRKILKQNKNFRDYNPNKIQAALIAINPQNGELKTIIGGDGFREDNQYNRALQALRQPGSAFKSIFYASIINNKYITPYSMVLDKYEDIPLKYNKVWKVHNYNNKYKDKEISVTEAIKISSNQVAAKLMADIGIDTTRQMIKETLNISKEQSYRKYKKGQYSAALGTVSITPIELLRLYAMIANKGISQKPKLIKEVKDITGKQIIINDELDNKKQVISKEAAYLISKMLKQVFTPGGTAYNIKNKYNINFDIAGKTGTSQNSRDLWFAGFTPELATVVWIGHDQNKPLISSGGKIAGPIFGEFMQYAKEKIPFSRFEIDDSYELTSLKICRESGQIADETRCTNIDYNAKFISGTEPGEYCQMEHIDNPFKQLLGIPIQTKKQEENNNHKQQYNNINELLENQNYNDEITTHKDLNDLTEN